MAKLGVMAQPQGTQRKRPLSGVSTVVREGVFVPWRTNSV
jgi:hypothetical protein